MSRTEAEVIINSTNGHFNYPDTLGQRVCSLAVRDSDGREDVDQVVATVIERDMRILVDAGNNKNRGIFLIDVISPVSMKSLCIGLQW